MTGVIAGDIFAGVGILGILGFSVGTYLKVNGSISRVYKRLDEVKDKADETYTKRDVCKVVHEAVKEDLKEVKAKVDCIPEIKAGVDLLLSRVKKE